MIYTASYNWTNHHHGKLISISRSIPALLMPERFKVDGHLEFFKPSEYLLNAYRKKKISEEGYIQRFREETRHNLPKIKLWLDGLKPEENQTLLCWEPPGQFCHRNLCIKFVERYRPDCFGGCDTPNTTTRQTNKRQDWLEPPKSPNARERIDFFIKKMTDNGWKPGSVVKAVFYDHEKGYIKLTYEDLKYLAQNLVYKPYWAIKQAEILGISREVKV